MSNKSIKSISLQGVPILCSLIKHTVGGISSTVGTFKNAKKEKLEKELVKIINNKNISQQFFEKLFSNGIPISSEFYLQLIQLPMPDNADGDLIKKVRGAILASANLILPKEKFEELLNLLLSLEWSEFFIIYGSLPSLFSNVQIAPVFAATWLPQLAQRCPSDEFFNAVAMSCDSFPKNMVDVINYLYEKENNYELIVASFLLGKLRTILKETSLSQKFKEVEKQFLHSKNQKMLSIYRLSWITSIRYNPTLYTELPTLIGNLRSNIPEEQQDAFDIICKSLQFTYPEEFLIFAQSWLKTYTSPELSSLTKETLIQFVWQQLDKYNVTIHHSNLHTRNAYANLSGE